MSAAHEAVVANLRLAAAEASRLSDTLRECMVGVTDLAGEESGGGIDGRAMAPPLRLVEPHASGVFAGPVELCGFRVDAGRHVVEMEGRRALLTPNEWQLFAALLAAPGRTWTRADLAVTAWGPGFAGRHGEVEVYISRLRRKLESNPRRPLLIETVRGAGYRLMPPGEDDLAPVEATGR